MATPVERISLGLSPQLLERVRQLLAESSGTFTPVTTVTQWIRGAITEKLERDELRERHGD